MTSHHHWLEEVLCTSIRWEAITNTHAQRIAFCPTLQVALQEAAVRVKMELVNRVTDVVVAAGSLPLDGTAVAGAAQVRVELETQDGRGLPWEAALEGLTLKLTPPGARPQSLTLRPYPEPCAASAPSVAPQWCERLHFRPDPSPKGHP